MRIFICFIAALFASSSVAAQVKPYHVFDYDVEVAHYTEDDSTIPDRLFKIGDADGDVLITRCTNHNEYMSGLRFVFNDKKKDMTKKAMFSVKCDRKTGALRMSFVERTFSKGNRSDDTVDIDMPLSAQVGSRLDLRIELSGETVYFRLGEQTMTRDIGFMPKDIQLLGIGATGIARFFEKNLIS